MINIVLDKTGDLLIRSKYLNPLIEISKKWGGSFDGEVWKIPKEVAPKYLKELSSCYYFDVGKDVLAYFNNLDSYIPKKENKINYPDTKIPKVSIAPWAHQEEAFRFLFERGGGILALPPGTGKTLIAILFAQLDESILYICPASAKTQIQREFKKFGNIDAVVIEPKKKRNYSYKGVIIVNYELFQRDYNFIPLKKVLILDESHKIKSPRKRTKTSKITPITQSVLEYADRGVKHTICMTGTPIISSLADTVNMMKVIGKLKTPNYWAWINTFAILDKFRNVIAYKPNVIHYINALYENTYMRVKEEILDIPERRVIHTVVTPTAAEKLYYGKLKAGILVEFEDDPQAKVLFNVLNFFVRARQAAISPHIIDLTKPKACSKTDWINNFLVDFEEKHLIIYSPYTKALDLTESLKEFKSKNIYRIDGKVPTNKRQDIIDKWEQTGGILLGSDSMSLELNMQFCSNMIIINLPTTWKDFDQVTSRIYRGCQQKVTSIYVLYMEDTIDERMWNLISEKDLRSTSSLNNMTAKLLSSIL